MIRWLWRKANAEDLEESRQVLSEVRDRRELTTKIVGEIHEIIERNHFGEKFHRALGGKTR